MRARQAPTLSWRPAVAALGSAALRSAHVYVVAGRATNGAGRRTGGERMGRRRMNRSWSLLRECLSLTRSLFVLRDALPPSLPPSLSCSSPSPPVTPVRIFLFPHLPDPPPPPSTPPFPSPPPFLSRSYLPFPNSLSPPFLPPSHLSTPPSPRLAAAHGPPAPRGGPAARLRGTRHPHPQALNQSVSQSVSQSVLAAVGQLPVFAGLDTLTLRPPAPNTPSESDGGAAHPSPLRRLAAISTAARLAAGVGPRPVP